MIKTQIQLPDELYAKVKQLAHDRELSMSELCRRGLEYMLRVHPLQNTRKSAWKIAAAKPMGNSRFIFLSGVRPLGIT